MTPPVSLPPPTTAALPSDPRLSSPDVPPGQMTFVEHLSELRTRLLVCLAILGGATGITFLAVTPMITLLQRLAPSGTLFVQLVPGELFLAGVKLSFLGGLGLSLPLILYHTIRFVSPGLKPHERRALVPMLLLGCSLFVAGVLFGYGVLLPMMLDFLLGYGTAIAQNQLSVASFLDFCSGFLFAGGLVFQLPLLLLLVSRLGLVSSATLQRQWKWAVLLSFLFGALLTPSADPFSQTVLAGALFGLYALSLALIRAFGR